MRTFVKREKYCVLSFVLSSEPEGNFLHVKEEI